MVAVSYFTAQKAERFIVSRKALKHYIPQKQWFSSNEVTINEENKLPTYSFRRIRYKGVLGAH